MVNIKEWWKEKKNQVRIKTIENKIRDDHFWNRITKHTSDFAKLTSIIVKTSAFSAGFTGIVAGVIASFATCLLLATMLVGNMIKINGKYAIWVIAASVLINMILIVWMFINRAYRHYWKNVQKMFRMSQRGLPFVYALCLYKNHSCIFNVFKVIDGQVEWDNKPYFIRQKGLYQDLVGRWGVVVLEEDNSEAKQFFTDQPYISADKLSAFMIKTKVWAEIWASRRNKTLLFVAIGIAVLVAISLFLLYQYHTNVLTEVSKACASQAQEIFNQCSARASDVVPK
jgi:hypothetical protein